MKTLETSYSRTSTGPESTRLESLRLNIIDALDRVIGSKQIPVSEILAVGVRVWELESLHLEQIETHRLNPRIVGQQYYVKSNVRHRLILEWLKVKPIERRNKEHG